MSVRKTIGLVVIGLVIALTSWGGVLSSNAYAEEEHTVKIPDRESDGYFDILDSQNPDRDCRVLNAPTTCYRAAEYWAYTHMAEETMGEARAEAYCTWVGEQDHGIPWNIFGAFNLPNPLADNHDSCMADWRADSLQIVDATIENAQAACDISMGVFNYIICGIMIGVGSMVDSVWDLIERSFTINSSYVSSETCNPSARPRCQESGVHKAWQTFVNIANIIFLIMLMIVIFSQVTGFGITNYGIKKVLPRLVIFALLINVSFFVCQIAVDVSNIVGHQLDNFMSNIVSGRITISFQQIVMMLLTGQVLWVAGGTIMTIALVVNALGLGIPGIIMTIVVVVEVLLFFLLLMLRNLGVMLLTILSPLAFAAMILPGTKGLFDKWRKFFVTLLVLYPVAGLMMGAANLAADILLLTPSDTGINQFAIMIAMLLKFSPIFIIPSMMKRTMAAMGGAGSVIDKLNQRFLGGSKKAAMLVPKLTVGAAAIAASGGTAAPGVASTLGLGRGSAMAAKLIGQAGGKRFAASGLIKGLSGSKSGLLSKVGRWVETNAASVNAGEFMKDQKSWHDAVSSARSTSDVKSMFAGGEGARTGGIVNDILSGTNKANGRNAKLEASGSELAARGEFSTITGKIKDLHADADKGSVSVGDFNKATVTMANSTAPYAGVLKTEALPLSNYTKDVIRADQDVTNAEAGAASMQGATQESIRAAGDAKRSESGMYDNEGRLKSYDEYVKHGAYGDSGRASTGMDSTTSAKLDKDMVSRELLENMSPDGFGALLAGAKGNTQSKISQEIELNPKLAEKAAQLPPEAVAKLQSQVGKAMIDGLNNGARTGTLTLPVDQIAQQLRGILDNKLLNVKMNVDYRDSVEKFTRDFNAAASQVQAVDGPTLNVRAANGRGPNTPTNLVLPGEEGYTNNFGPPIGGAS
ncbi:MAG: type IV secretion system protein [Candidatus Nomurabacteria bacterium]|nr:type IV secretion system protein [Candidatus Nomurabacteria bacterium]